MTALAPVLERPSHRSGRAAERRRHPTAIEVAPPPATASENPIVSRYRVHRARAAIARGSYDDPKFLDFALDRMIDAVRASR